MGKTCKLKDVSFQKKKKKKKIKGKKKKKINKKIVKIYENENEN